VLAESGSDRIVLKQALGKLRVEQEWLSERTRIWREAEAIRLLAPYFPPGAVPPIAFEDRDNCIYAMEAAPPGARPWKTCLLEGELDLATAETVGDLLARMIRASRESPAWETSFGDQTVFDQLRLDPYYRSTALVHPDLAGFFDSLIDDCSTRRYSLVHGDWSPKNFLVEGISVMAIDFEVIHYGNPAFDTGFLLNHLLLKSYFLPAHAGGFAQLAARFWETLRAGLQNEPNCLEFDTIRQLGGLLLARIDGKSPAEYIRDPDLKQRIRDAARRLIQRPPCTLREVFGL
jgi:5-methylthioribose kinase